mmetsp:Transcript_61985/g.166088  ORF Transcript_61985/g.166088 Transcript_61985/m.166088 type:complete len:210 (+) Transcript_61985:1024-1653(+)
MHRCSSLAHGWQTESGRSSCPPRQEAASQKNSNRTQIGPSRAPMYLFRGPAPSSAAPTARVRWRCAQSTLQHSSAGSRCRTLRPALLARTLAAPGRRLAPGYRRQSQTLGQNHTPHGRLYGRRPRHRSGPRTICGEPGAQPPDPAQDDAQLLQPGMKKPTEQGPMYRIPVSQLRAVLRQLRLQLEVAPPRNEAQKNHSPWTHAARNARG